LAKWPNGYIIRQFNAVVGGWEVALGGASLIEAVLLVIGVVGEAEGFVAGSLGGGWCG